jgi:hypothetical protein
MKKPKYISREEILKARALGMIPENVVTSVAKKES